MLEMDEAQTARDVAIEHISAEAFTVPTADGPESDGTLIWDSTTLVVVHVAAGGVVGMGYTYAAAATALFIRDKMASVLEGVAAMDVPRLHDMLRCLIRNEGQVGIAAMAVSAVDTALWDLKARLLNISLVDLLGSVRDSVSIYGSGGFTNYSDDHLADQLSSWVKQGIPRVKMKVGREPDQDPHRVGIARRAIGEDVELFVDANGGYSRKQAVRMAQEFADQANVTWFEEPRPSTDLDGLRVVRDHAPAPMEVAAGEYGYHPPDFQRMLVADCVDCPMADVTRCGGYSGFMNVAAQCSAHLMPLSIHCAPNLSAHVGCAMPAVRHIEYFHDHVRIEHLLFDGALRPDHGSLSPDRTRPGHGLEFKRDDAEQYRAA